jgi:hypothetical protein
MNHLIHSDPTIRLITSNAMLKLTSIWPAGHPRRSNGHVQRLSIFQAAALIFQLHSGGSQTTIGHNTSRKRVCVYATCNAHDVWPHRLKWCEVGRHLALASLVLMSETEEKCNSDKFS